MMIPETTSLAKSSEALATAVKNFGITANEARIAFDSLTTTAINASDLIGFTYVGDNFEINGNNNKLTVSSSPRHAQELHNCENCGGTVDEKGYCRFCGSRVYFFGS